METGTIQFLREVTDMTPDAFLPVSSKNGYYVFRSRFNEEYLYLYNKSTHKIYEFDTSLDMSLESNIDKAISDFELTYSL